MAGILLQDIPSDSYAQLARAGQANSRTPAPESPARAAASFDSRDRSSPETVNRLMDAALASSGATFAIPKFTRGCA